MGKYKKEIIKLKYNFYFRILLCCILLTLGALFVRFGSNVMTHAESIEVVKNSNSDMQVLNTENNSSGENNIAAENNIDNNTENAAENAAENTAENAIENATENAADNKDYEEIEILRNNYIVASSTNSDKYPEDWIKNFNRKIIILQTMFPTGKYWNHMGQTATNPYKTNNIYSVTDIPCNHSIYGESFCNAHYGKSNDLYPYKATCSQCRGFASVLSDYIFGEDAPVKYLDNYDDLRIGDQARIDGDYHSVFIIDKTDEYVIVAECNSDLQTCQIQWGRKILREDMSGWYITRWTD